MLSEQASFETPKQALRWCRLMLTGLKQVYKAHPYFKCLPAYLGSRSFNDISKLGVSVFFRSPLTDAWVKLARRATTLLDWAWHTEYSVSCLDLSKSLTLDFPSRTARYTLSRGPMVRKKKSREQVEAGSKKCGFWVSLGLPALGVILAQPVAWYWTLRDLIFFFRSVNAFCSLDSVILSVNRLSTVNAIPAVGFICIV